MNHIQERAGLLRHGREEVVDGVNLAETHCIDWIGSLEYANVTKVAGEMDMTRGAISKICKKLLCRRLIESFQRPDNQKEIYFRLTESGSRVYDEHKKAHNEAIKQKMAVLAEYSDVEKMLILRFLNDMNRLSYLKLAAQGDAESGPG
jgi:DNA-binding MarR family transcriptional regulator